MTTVNLSHKLGPVTKYTLSEQVVTILKRFILMENLSEGDQLPSERELVAALGVSHRVVREALGLLAGEGLITKRHGLGAFVQSFDHQRLLADLSNVPAEFPHAEDLHEARCALECGAAYIAATKATDEDIATLQALVDDLQQSSEQGKGPIIADVRFHQTLLQATHNKTLQSLQPLINKSMRLYNVWTNPAGIHRKIQEVEHIVRAHQAIVDAIRERDPVQTSRATYIHVKLRGEDI